MATPPPPLPDGFPSDLATDTLRQTVEKYVGRISMMAPYPSQMLVHGEHVHAVIQLGQWELDRRQSESQLHEAQQRDQRATTIHYIALAISLLALSVAVVVAVTEARSGRRWEQREIERLTAVEARLVEVQGQLDSLDAYSRQIVAATQAVAEQGKKAHGQRPGP